MGDVAGEPPAVPQGAWWLRGQELCAELDRVPNQGVSEFYRLGDAFLELDCDDSALAERFRTTLGECRVAPAAARSGARSRCIVRSGNGVAVAAFEDPEPLEIVPFILANFADRGYHEVASALPRWRMIAPPDGPPLLASRGETCLVDRTQAWQGLLGNLAVNRVLRLQRGVLFFHAAAAVLGDAGILVTGPKGTGKSTTSLSLAARGHAFLGDEIAAVRVGTWDLLPFRRAVSIRPGPCSRLLTAALDSRPGPWEDYPDGSQRRRMLVAELFPQAGARVRPLRAIFFLRRFADRARVEPLAPRLQDVQRLAPLACTLWGIPPALRLMHLLQLLSGVRCFLMDPGDPDESAELIERTMEQLR